MLLQLRAVEGSSGLTMQGWGRGVGWGVDGYLHVGGAAPEVLRLGPPASAGLALSASIVLQLCRPHHHKVHTHLAGLHTHTEESKSILQITLKQSSLRPDAGALP